VVTYGFLEGTGNQKSVQNAIAHIGINRIKVLRLNNFSSARKILEALKEGTIFLCLRELAKASGFRSASNKDFKDGFNYLVDKGVLKLQQSGWRSEKRGSGVHEKTVILTADIYEIRDSEFEIDPEKLDNIDSSVLVGLRDVFLNGKKLSKHRMTEYRNCEDCKKNPALYITSERIGLCQKHWNLLASSDVEWGN